MGGNTMGMPQMGMPMGMPFGMQMGTNNFATARNGRNLPPRGYGGGFQNKGIPA
jgi:hypothetical protein